MSDEVKVSVIMPVYNTVRYFDECINSVIRQEYKNLEILVIDAGSTDGTLDIIYDVMRKDTRIKLIYSEIKSYGYQVNLGIKKSAGKYICIVEADDFVESDCLQEMVELAEENHLDVIKAEYMFFITGQDGNRIFSDNPVFENDKWYGKVICGRDFTELLAKDIYIWKGMYRRDFLIQNKLFFYETPGAAFQDYSFSFKTLLLAERLMYIKRLFYNYRRDNEFSSCSRKDRLMLCARESSLLMAWLKEWELEGGQTIMPYFYLKLMDHVNTTFYTYMLNELDYEFPMSEVLEVQDILKNSILNNLAFAENFNIGTYLNIKLFVENYDFFYLNMRYKVESLQTELKYLMDKMRHYGHVVIWGYGHYGRMLHMILGKKGMTGNLIVCDSDERVVESNTGLLNANEVARNRTPDTLFVICCNFEKYNIRRKLRQQYGLSDDDIVFYEMGAMQYLLSI